MLVIQQQFKNSSFNFLKTIARLLTILFCAVVFCLPIIYAQAQDINTELNTVAETAALPETPLPVIVGNILNIFYGFLGLILFGIIIYAGYTYMTSGGDPEKTKKAKNWLKYGIIGLIIILSAFAITSYIISKLTDATGAGGGGGLGGGTGGPNWRAYGTNKFGSVIQDHYPGVDMTVERINTISVTFRQAINPGSIISDSDGNTMTCVDLSKDNTPACVPEAGAVATGVSGCVCSGKPDPAAIKLYRACDSVYDETVDVVPEAFQYDEARNDPKICNQWEGAAPADNILNQNGVITVLADMRTVIYDLYEPLGSSQNSIRHFVSLSNAITKFGTATGVFGSADQGYAWAFTTTTELDATPPYIVSVAPAKLDANGQPRPADYYNDEDANSDNNKFERNINAIVIKFNEPIRGLTFLNNQTANANQEITVLADTVYVSGSYDVGIDQYRSVVFHSSAPCSVPALFNTCGDEIFCLPGESTITVTARSVPTANLSAVNPLQADPNKIPFGGIVDFSKNALDTDGLLDGPNNGQANGVADDFRWQFKTSDEIDITPPKITTVYPSHEADKSSGVTPQSLIGATFDDDLDSSTATNANVGLDVVAANGEWNGWVGGGMCHDDEITPDCYRTLMIRHAPLPESVAGEAAPIITPQITSGIKDINGNCFNPCADADCPANPSVGDSCHRELSQIP
jgi:hypothetical protein